MADEDLTVRATIDNELSPELREIRQDLDRVGDEATSSGRRASIASRGWATFGRAANTAGRLAKGALLGIAAGAAAAGYATARLMQSSIAEASTLAESLNAVNVVYKDQAGAVKQLGREAAKTMGLSNVQFNGLAVQFSSFAQAIGGEGKGSVRVLEDLTTRAADFASVMNIEVAEAAELFQSGLAGESEPLRKYGINLSAAAVGNYALSKGISDSATELTDAQKVTATYGLLMEKTAVTQGDFANTSDSLANQQRILGARFDNAKAKLGKGLLPMMQTAVQYLNREGIPMFLRFSDWFVNEGIPKMQRFITKARELYNKHLPQIKSVLADVRDVAKAGADAGKELVEAFVGMPSWARKLLVGGVAGGIIAKKTGLTSLLGGLGKGAGGIAGLASKAKPLPVWVVNNGDLGGGPGGKPGKPGAGTGGLLAGLSRWATRIGRMGGAGAGLAASGFYMDRGVIDEKGDPAKIASPEQTKALLDSIKHIDRDLTAARANAAGLGEEFDRVGARKVTPELKADSIARANDALATFIGYQIDADRPVTPYINTTSIERALAQVATLTANIHAIPTAGVDNGVPFVGGGATPPAPSGGGGKGNNPPPPPPPNVVPRAHTRAGTRTGGRNGGGVTLGYGAIQVNNPASDLDLEVAIANGLSRAERERAERSLAGAST